MLLYIKQAGLYIEKIYNLNKIMYIHY